MKAGVPEHDGVVVFVGHQEVYKVDVYARVRRAVQVGVARPTPVPYAQRRSSSDDGESCVLVADEK